MSENASAEPTPPTRSPPAATATATATSPPDTSNGTLAYTDASQLTVASAAAGGRAGSATETLIYAGVGENEPLADGSATGITHGLADQYGQPWVDSYTTGGGVTYIIRTSRATPSA
jgi:hypothetical protein